MRRFDVHAFYLLAQTMKLITDCQVKDTVLKDIVLPLIRARLELGSQIRRWPAEMSAARRAVSGVLGALDRIGVPQSVDGFEHVDLTKTVVSWEISNAVQKVRELESVLANEVPGLAVWYIASKGLYATDGLMSSAWMQLVSKPDDPDALHAIESVLPQTAKDDINEAGKALVLELPTASAFHLWRAVETVMGEYYKALTGGHTFADDKVQRSWYKYIEALTKAGAESKVTKYLDHIRSEYRNPTMHPEETPTLDEVFALFGAALSVVSQTLKLLPQPPAVTTPPLPPPYVPP